ncbi:MAG: DUF4920 domain-containing protein [Rhodospirillales bacterium]
MRLLLIAVLACAPVLAGEVKLGKPLALKEATPIDQLVANPDRYVGKAVQVKGTVRDVCQRMGCWTEVANPASGKSVRVKVKDGEIVFPKNSIGKTIVVEGTLAKIEQTREQVIAQAQHEAEENNRKFDPASITSGRTYYQIQGTGAVIIE